VRGGASPAKKVAAEFGLKLLDPRVSGDGCVTLTLSAARVNFRFRVTRGSSETWCISRIVRARSFRLGGLARSGSAMTTQRIAAAWFETKGHFRKWRPSCTFWPDKRRHRGKGLPEHPNQAAGRKGAKSRMAARVAWSRVFAQAASASGIARRSAEAGLGGGAQLVLGRLGGSAGQG